MRAAKKINTTTEFSPKTPQLHPEMIKRLSANVTGKLVIDVRELRKPGAELILIAKGFQLESCRNGTRVYSIGQAHVFGQGQRAAIFSDGTVALSSFSSPFVEIIKTDKLGNITLNSIQRLDR
jgi:hypothetical protein